MNFNLHPIIVHFPIAFLFVYSTIKILPVSKWLPKVSWGQIERMLLTIGVIGAFASLATGETAQHMTRPDRQLVNMHSAFAVLSVWIYCILLAGEVVALFNQKYLGLIKLDERLVKLLKFLESILYHDAFAKILAALGFIAIFLTGLLGGVMVYGLTADPLAGIVLKILGIAI
jgi:uncharacterized membrane protein